MTKMAKLISGELLCITGRNDAIVAAIIAATVAVSVTLPPLIACRRTVLLLLVQNAGPDSLLIT